MHILESQAVAENDSAVQGQTGLRAVPEDELLDRTPVGTAGLQGPEAIENAGLGTEFVAGSAVD